VSGIVEFLTARLDAQSAVAEASGGGVWDMDSDGETCAVNDSSTGESVVYVEGGLTLEEGQHIALNDPAYVLADIAAKRQILAAHQREVLTSDGSMPDECYHCCEPWVCPTVRLLAAPFAQYPDFDPAWKLKP